MRPDSGGEGRHRGGLGAVYEIELLEGEADLTLFGERARFAPPGVAGGGAGAMTRFSWQTEKGAKAPPMASKLVDARLAQGHRLRLETPGGGGYGDASGRDAEAIARDRALGYIA